METKTTVTHKLITYATKGVGTAYPADIYNEILQSHLHVNAADLLIF